MNTLLALVAGPSGTAPLSLDGLTARQVAQLDGRRVQLVFTVGTPAYLWERGRATLTVVGPADRGEVPSAKREGFGAEWSVVLTGDRLANADDGARLEVVGTVRVIRHPAAVVGGALVAEWTEVRVCEE
jgi:hypothetical protein